MVNNKKMKYKLQEKYFCSYTVVIFKRMQVKDIIILEELTDICFNYGTIRCKEMCYIEEYLYFVNIQDKYKEKLAFIFKNKY